MIGLHLWSNLPVGTVAVRPGPVFAGGAAFLLTVKGKGGHAALPHEAVDPIVIAASITTALQTLISRETPPFSPAILSVTSIEAGTAFNIIPEEAVMKGSMRFMTPEHGKYLQGRVEAIAKGIAAVMGGSCTMELPLGVPPCANDPAMTQLVHHAAALTVGEEQILTGNEAMTMASDDMAYFLQAAPGCYFLVGAQNEQVGAAYPHHHPRFNIDEDALPIAVEVLSRAALEFLEYLR